MADYGDPGWPPGPPGVNDPVVPYDIVPPPPDAMPQGAVIPADVPPPYDPSMAGGQAPAPPPYGAPPDVALPPPDVALPPSDVGLPPEAGGLPSGPQPPPPPPPVDAVTDAVGMPVAGEINGIPYAPTLTPDQHYAQTAKEYADHPWDIPDQTERDRAAASMAVNNPVAFQTYRIHLAEAKEAAFAAAQLKAEQDNLQKLKDDIADRQKADAITQAKSDQIVADAIKLSQTKTDRSRWFKNQSVGQQVASIGAAIVGGFLQAKNGGRNQGMDWITSSIDKDVEDQKADIENARTGLSARQNAVAQEYARTGNLYQAAETVRLASYQTAIDQLKTQQQDYDPRGTSFANVGSGIQQLVGAQQASIESHRKEIHAETLADLKEERERAMAQATIAKTRAETAKLYADASQAKEKDQVFSPAELAAIHPGAPVPPIGRTLKDYKTWLDTHKAGQEAALGDREYGIGDVRPTKDADGNVVGSTSVPFVNADGKLFRAPSTKEAESLRNQKAGVDTTAHFIDEMTAGIKKYGGSTEFFKSPEWQTMQANKESLLFGLHQAYGVEGFRPGVLEQMEHALGGQDPNKITVLSTNAVPGLEAAKQAVVSHFNSNLRAMEYTGKEYSPPPAPKAESFPTFSDRTAAESAPGPLDNMGAGLRQDADALLHPLDLNPAPDTGPDLGPRLGPTGLSIEDTSKVEDLVKRYNNGTPATKAKVVEALAAPLTTGRQSLNTGILGLVAGDSPELYHQLLQALPADERERWLRDQAAVSAMQAQLPGNRR